MNNRFRQKLQQQVMFLENSCRAFDRGQWIEAIRIATSVRVIIHDTARSASLLAHLNAKDINLFTTYVEPQPPAPGYEQITAFGMGVITMGAGGKYGYGPNLDDFSPDSSNVLPVDKWWNQVVWILDPSSRLTKKDVILSAANKDGGAHVDKELDENYKRLATTNWGQFTLRHGTRKLTWRIDNMHLVAIRTIANELLKSPEFLALAELPS